MQIDVRIPGGIQTGSAVPVVVIRWGPSSEPGGRDHRRYSECESNRNRHFDRVGNRGDHGSGRKRLLHQFEQRV